jgi:hypothetical protein
MRADSEEEHMSLIKAKRERIRELNDAFRKTLDPALGKSADVRRSQQSSHASQSERLKRSMR